MQTSASPRHPFKALCAVIAMLVLVHAALPHIGSHDPLQAVNWSSDCPDINVHIEDADPDGPVIDVSDADRWS